MKKISKRPTPETDGQPMSIGIGCGGTYSMVDADFARRLERERDEAIEARKVSAADWLSQVENAELRVKHALEIAAKCVKQFDEANCKMADAMQEVDLRTLDFERMKQERDEAQEALMKIEDICVDCEDACDDIQKIRDIARAVLEK